MNEDQPLSQILERLHQLDKRGTTDALEVGSLLMKAKGRLDADAGQSFSDWLRGEFAWSHRTADRFMRARKWYDRQPVKTRHCVEASLTVSALYVISAENVPLAAQQEILKIAKARRVGGTVAREAVARAKAAEVGDDPLEDTEAITPSALVKAVETILKCNPHSQELDGLSCAALVGASEILSQLGQRLRSSDVVQLAADRAEARSATRKELQL